MPDVISDTNGKLCVGSYHMWRLLSNPDNYSFRKVKKQVNTTNCEQSALMVLVCIRTCDGLGISGGMTFMTSICINECSVKDE